MWAPMYLVPVYRMPVYRMAMVVAPVVIMPVIIPVSIPLVGHGAADQDSLKSCCNSGYDLAGTSLLTHLIIEGSNVLAGETVNERAGRGSGVQRRPRWSLARASEDDGTERQGSKSACQCDILHGSIPSHWLGFVRNFSISASGAGCRLLADETDRGCRS